jgi:hypothetical protein
MDNLQLKFINYLIDLIKLSGTDLPTITVN